MAQGGDLYHAFREGKRIASEDVKFSDVLTRHLRNAGTVGLPPKGAYFLWINAVNSLMSSISDWPDVHLW